MSAKKEMGHYARAILRRSIGKNAGLGAFFSVVACADDHVKNADGTFAVFDRSRVAGLA
jgi:hypothetical protein